MDRNALIVGFLVAMLALSAMAIEGRYPLTGIHDGGGASGAATAVVDGSDCTLPATLPCTLGE